MKSLGRKDRELQLHLDPVKPGTSSRWMRFRDACDYVGWGKDKMYGLIRQGVIEARKAGKLTMINLDSIDAYMRTLPGLALRERRIRQRRQERGRK